MFVVRDEAEDNRFRPLGTSRPGIFQHPPSFRTRLPEIFFKSTPRGGETLGVLSTFIHPPKYDMGIVRCHHFVPKGKGGTRIGVMSARGHGSVYRRFGVSRPSHKLPYFFLMRTTAPYAGTPIRS